MFEDTVVRRFVRDENGATAIEYGVICAGMAVIIVTLAGTGGALEAIYETCRRIIAAVAGANEGADGS